MTILFPTVALACSGLGVEDLIDANIRLSAQLFAVGCVLVTATVAVYFVRRNYVSLIIALFATITLAAHPVWTVSAFVGDCGALKATSSLKATVGLAVLLLAQLASGLVPFLLRRAHNKSLDRSGVRLLFVRKT